MAYVHAYPQRTTFEASCAAKANAGAVGPLRRPTTAAFSAFCRTLSDRCELTDRVWPESVVGLQRIRQTSASWAWRVELGDGSAIMARQVVWAANPRRRRVPDGVELGGCVVHSSDVDLADVRSGERVAVLGGGQSAGQLALQAAQRGASTTLISRGPRRIADLDVDAGWLMDDHLDPFRAIDDPVERRSLVERAQRGSMTTDLDRALRRARVAHVADAGEVTARTSDRGPVVGFAGVECQVDRVWAATGSVPDLRRAGPLAALAEQRAPHVDGWPVLDADLQWLPGLFIVGALAALTLGPAAGNLGGARAAADLLACHGPAPAPTEPAVGSPS
ncbi:MAG: hypothetical protein AAGC53_04740 [Actinomycetota bacterium]